MYGNVWFQIALVTNVASECGYTDSHYKAFAKVQESLGADGKFTILAFPCNQFGAQEPGSNLEIAQSMKAAYGVNFPMFAKVDVVGPDAEPAFQYLVG